jgi:hypothetical protein
MLVIYQRKVFMFFRLFIAFLVTLFSCTPSTHEDMKKEGQKIISQIILELHSITTREELVKKRNVLKKNFDRLALLIIESEKINNNIYKDDEDFNLYSDELKNQMIRIYEIDGGQELIESYQKNALRLLAEKNISP